MELFEEDMGRIIENHPMIGQRRYIPNVEGVITVTVDNQEPLAYLAGWLSRQVNNFMMNHIEAQQQPKE